MRLIASSLGTGSRLGRPSATGGRRRSSRKPARRQAWPIGRARAFRRRRSRRAECRRAAAARRDPSRAERSTKRPSVTSGRSGPVEVTRPSKPAWAGPTGPSSQDPPLSGEWLSRSSSASLVGDLDPVEQVGPPRVVPQRMGIGAIDQVAPHVDRRDRPRAVGPVKARPDLQNQATAQIGRFDRRGKLAGLLPLPRVVVVAGQDRAIQQPADALVGRRANPRAQRDSHVVHRHFERRFFANALL